MSRDFLNSVAQEDVSFITQITRKSVAGENFYKLLVFIEGNPAAGGVGVQTGRFIADPLAFVPLEEGSPFFIAEVTIDNYHLVTNGLLHSWLADFFAPAHAGIVYLVVYGRDLPDTPTPADITAAVTALEAAYAEVKTLAYHKTICAGGDTALLPTLAVTLAELCNSDKDLLSAAPYYPLTIANAADFAEDPIYEALATADASFTTVDAFMTAHADITRNGSLYSLGLAISYNNSTGTPVGNNMDFWASAGISPSGPDGSSLSRTVRNTLKGKNIAFFKYVGDNTGQVAAVGVKTLAGRVVQAHWIVNYINYMCKVKVATFITKPNVMRNASTYAGVINIMTAQVGKFGGDGSGRLKDVVISAPSFLNLPPSEGDEIVVPKAWSAEYADQIHRVRVYGNLIISA